MGVDAVMVRFVIAGGGAACLFSALSDALVHAGAALPGHARRCRATSPPRWACALAMVASPPSLPMAALTTAASSVASYGLSRSWVSAGARPKRR